MNPNPPPPPPPFAAEPPATWWSRNKKWAIPVGCVGMLAIAGCCGLPLALGMFGIQKAAQYAQHHETAMQGIRSASAERIQRNEQIRALVGEPVTVAPRETSPHWNYDNGKLDYRFVFPVTGPKGELTVQGHASAPDGETPLKLRSLDFDDGERKVDLLEQ